MNFGGKRFGVITRDADKSGFITRSDFELVIERYKKIVKNTDFVKNFL